MKRGKINNRLRYLFYIVHPSKYHLFKNTINELRSTNHTVDLIINTKDVLENLIVSEGWEYTNIFPKGRNISKKPSIIKSAFKFIITIFRIEKYLFKNQRYDLFVTDDSLVINGWVRRIPTYIFNDNDIQTIKINKILFYFAQKIISPQSTDLGNFNNKTISFNGNKAMAHLHPSYFTPLPKSENHIDYCIIRLSRLNATHDTNDNYGIMDNDLNDIYDMIDDKYKIIIISERELPLNYHEYIFDGNPNDLPNLLYHSSFLISDSGTMATEAAILGVPNILINKLAKDIGVHQELHNEGLQFYFDKISDSLSMINEFILNKDIKSEFMKNKTTYIEQCDDLNKMMLDLFTYNGDNK